MKCKRCDSENPDESRFCSVCGSLLSVEWEAIERLVDDRLEKKIRATLKEEFSDQKALEIETSELVAERALKWAKTFGFFAGIPLVLITAIMGFIGVHTWSDVQDASDRISKANTALSIAQSTLDTASKRTGDLVAQVDSLQSQISHAKELLAAIPDIQKRQDDIENKLKNFTCSRNLAPDAALKYDKIVEGYKAYIISVDLVMPPNIPCFGVQDSKNMMSSMISYYEPRENIILVNEKAIDDPSVWLRDFTHWILANQDSKNNNTRMMTVLYPIESILAYYLPCSYFNSPKVGELTAKSFGTPYLANIGGSSDFSRYDHLDSNAKPYQGAEIVGGVFWEIRENIDHLTADKFLVSAWKNFIKSDKATALEFLKLYRRQFQSGDASGYASIVDGVFKRHNVTLASD